MPTSPRALLLAADVELIDGRYLPPLLPLVDRPFLQHIVERLTDAGIAGIDLVVSAQAERIEALIGDGSRWGITVAYHLAANREQGYELMRAIAAAADPAELILIGHADCLPIVPLRPYLASSEAFIATDAASGEWTGWALLQAGHLSAPDFTTDEDSIDRLLARSEAGTILPVATTLSVRTLSDLLIAQKTLLDQSYPGLLRTGREVEDGVHLSRNVVLHHSVTIVPPVFLGQDCRVAAGAEIGPYAVIGDGCIVDEGATVAESLILPGSYLGEEIEVRESVVDRNRLMNVRLGESIDLTDRFLLGDLHAPAAGWAVVSALLERLLAFLLLILTLPVLAIAALTRLATAGRPYYRLDCVALPASSTAFPLTLRTVARGAFLSEDEAARADGWRHALFVALPGLLDVIQGTVHFVGVPALTRDRVANLPMEWRSLYLHSRIGLITERLVTYGPTPTADEAYSADAYYVVTASFAHNATLVGRYLARLVAPRMAQSAEAGTRA